MSYGLTVINNFNTVLIDPEYQGVRLVQQGTITPTIGTEGVVVIGLLQNLTDPPIVLLKPSGFNRYVGGVSIGAARTGYPNGSVTVLGKVGIPFEYAIFSSRGTAIETNTDYGLEVFSSQSALIFSSKHSRPRITSLFNVNSFSSPTTFSFSGHSQIPWIFANTLNAFESFDTYSYAYYGFQVGFTDNTTARLIYGVNDLSSSYPSFNPSSVVNTTNMYPFQFGVAKVFEAVE